LSAEAIPTGPARHDLFKQPGVHPHSTRPSAVAAGLGPTEAPAQVNHAVSFHALKSQIIQLLVSEEPIGQVLPKLERMFLDNPVFGAARTEKCAPKTVRPWRSYHYQRNTRKSVSEILL